MIRSNRIIRAGLVFVLSLCLIAGLCMVVTAEEQAPEELTVQDITIEKDPEFGAIYLHLTNDDMHNLGFQFGDSITLSFSNGCTFENIPYFSGYYVPVGSVLICGYPSYPYVAVARNYSASIWDEINADENTLATLTLVKSGEYQITEELYHLIYDDVQDEDETDEIFANFRAVKGGNLKDDWIYRSASPVDNTRSRASVSDRLAQQYGIKAVLNLSDSKEELETFRQDPAYSSDYYDSLEQNGSVVLLNLDANYTSEKYAQTLSKGILEMVQHEGPYLIHCQEGKDRTGFVCALLLALAGADREEITADYMETYNNYYGITQEQPDKYAALTDIVQEFLDYLTSLVPENEITDPESAGAYEKAAQAYLVRGGLTEAQIEEIRSAIVSAAD